MPNDEPSPNDAHTLSVQQLFVRNQPALLAYVLSIEPRLSDAEEIVQEVFLTVSRKAATWVEGTNFLAWACTIARYHALDYQRTRSRRGARLADDVVDLLYDVECLGTEDTEELAAMQRCIRRLAPRAQELIRLRYHAGRLPAQIAESIGWSANAVRVGLARARAALRECLQRQMISRTNHERST